MISKGFSSKSLKELIEDFSELSIARQYLEVQDIPEMISSPFRRDENPSFSLFYGKNNRIYYKDFGNGESGSLFNLLERLWNTDIFGVCRRLLKDSGTRYQSSSHRRTVRKLNSSIQVVRRDWRPYDLEYWESFGINREWLEFGDVYPISTMLFDQGDRIVSVPCEKYAYAYVERKDGKVTIKTYQPFSHQYKWMSSHDSSVWDLWTKIPQSGDNLIITSSRKDALCLWANSGIPALSLQGEGYIPKSQVVNQLKSRYKNIYILYDNDFQSDENHGRIFGKNLSEMFGLKQIEIPDFYKCKDISDLCKCWDRQTVYNVVHSLIQTN